jgi:hypothetical protein
VTAAPDAAAAVGQIFEETVAKDQHVRTLAWLALDDGLRLSLRHEYPTVAKLREMVGDDPDAQLRLMAAFTMVYGWTVFGDSLLDAFGHDPADRPDVESRLAALLHAVVTSR